VEAGQLLKFDQIMVTDVFGQKTIVDHFRKQPQNEHWGLFELSAPSNNFDQIFIPPVADTIMESEPEEQVNFIRDEMANLAWGIEAIIPNGLGEGEDGYEKAIAMRDYYADLEEAHLEETEQETLENEANIKYQLANQVPENWIPFKPVRSEKTKRSYKLVANQLQRAAMPRVLKGFETKRIRPKTRLLNEGLLTRNRKPYFIAEEEVPRSGVIVKAGWQRTRWYNGKVVLWYGYKKHIGRGEGSSNLMFDQILPKYSV